MNTKKIVVGQRIWHSGAGSRCGVVAKIYGEQSPESCGKMGGVVAYGGRATFDIVWDNGTMTNKLPESILRSLPYMIRDEIASADEIMDHFNELKATALRHAANKDQFEADQEAKAEKYLAEFGGFLERAEQAPTGNTGGKFVAKNIRKELKRAFPKIRFYVTSDYNSVKVKWTNGPTKKAVDAIVDKYKIGSFNGTTDSYDYSDDRAFNKLFGGCQYVFTRREYTDEAELAVRRAFCEFRGEKYAENRTYISGHTAEHWGWLFLSKTDIPPGFTPAGLQRTETEGGFLEDFYAVVLVEE